MNNLNKILSFSEYTKKTNESDLFGVETSPRGNYPPGFIDQNRKSSKDFRGINPQNHKLKVIASDKNEFAILEDKQGKKFVFYFDATDPRFQENYLIYNDESEEYEIPDDLGIQEAANDIPDSAYGIGVDGWEDSSKEIIELDEELVDDLLDEFEKWVKTDSRKIQVQEVLKSLGEEFLDFNESIEIEGSEIEDQIHEAEGIHSAIRQRLLDYLKDNADATYPEAKKYIGEKIAGWKLTEEDFEEAKQII